MTRRRIYRDRIGPVQAEEMLSRLSKRFTPWTSLKLREADAVAVVSRAIDPARGEDDPEATAEDVLDALAMAGPAMFYLEVSELELLAYARHVLGIEWDQIGLRLGYAPSGAKQGASGRYARLAGRYPWVVERIKKTRDETASAKGEHGDD